jgi:hypothetical protein
MAPNGGTAGHFGQGSISEELVVRPCQPWEVLINGLGLVLFKV